MYGNNEKTDYLGLIRFADMIPVPESEVSIINVKNNNKQYNMLLYKQYRYINKTANRNLIREKSKTIYNIVVCNKTNRTTVFYKKLCCDFKIWEEKYLTYIEDILI